MLGTVEIDSFLDVARPPDAGNNDVQTSFGYMSAGA